MKLDMPPPPSGIWATLNRRAAIIGESRSAAPDPYVLTGNYRGAFYHLADEGVSFGVDVLWPTGGIEKAKAQLEQKLGPDAWIAVAAAVGNAVSLFVPIAGLVAATGIAGHNVIKWLDTATAPAQPPKLGVVVRELVKAAAQKGPMFLLLDSVDAPGREILWHTALFTLANYNIRGLQIVAGVDGPAEIRDNASGGLLDGSSVLGSIQALVAAEKLEAEVVPELDMRRIVRWKGPVGDDLAAQLLAQSGSADEPAARIWARWESSGYVERDAQGAWVASALPDPVLDGIHGVLDALVPPEKAQAALQALRVASVSGRVFSGSAVFGLVEEDSGVPAGDTEDLIDRLTPLAGSSQPWLVDTVNSITDADGETHWLYRFDSDSTRRYLVAHYEEGELRSMSSRLLDVAISVHGLTAEFLEPAALLARQAHRFDEERLFNSRQAAFARMSGSLARASVLLDGAEAPDTPMLLCEMLLQSSVDLEELGFLPVAKQVSSAAVRIARRHKSPHLIASSTLRFGIILTLIGDAAAAQPILEESLELKRSLYHDQPTPVRLHGLAVALGALADVNRLRGDPSAAVPLFRESAQCHRELYLATMTQRFQHEVAVSLSDLGAALSLADMASEAILVLDEAVGHHREVFAAARTVDNARGLAIVLARLGLVQRKVGDIDAAHALMSESLGIQQRVFESEPTPDHRRDLAVFLGELGSLESRWGNESAAPSLLLQSVNHFEILYDAQPEPDRRYDLAVSLGSAGRDCVVRGDAGSAHMLLEKSVFHLEQLSAEHPTPRHIGSLASALGELGAVYLLQNDSTRAVATLERSTSLLRKRYMSQPTQAHRNDLVIVLLDAGRAHERIGNEIAAQEARREAEKLQRAGAE